MSAYNWQKSSYSNEGANCVNVATAPDGTLRLRESDDPDVILAATRAGLSALLASIKAGGSAEAQPEGSGSRCQWAEVSSQGDYR